MVKKMIQWKPKIEPESDKTLGIVCARAGSKRLPNKNELEINGIPNAVRAYQTLDKICDQTVLVTDIQKFLKSDMDTMERPDFISADHIPLQSTVKFAINRIDKVYGVIVLIFANAPMITGKHVEKCLKLLKDKQLNIVRTYTDNVESGLIVMRMKYFEKHWIDTHCGSVNVKSIEIHTQEDYDEVKQIME